MCNWSPNNFSDVCL
ncbi:TPA: hypothetical protein IB990_003992 [Escherichia coli]|nr:hypothetical protein [Escherichia coli]